MNIFDISQSLADTLFNLSNIVLAVGAFLALLGTIGVAWTGSIRERYADERIARNESETASAKAAAAVANNSAASANERTEVIRQTNLELQRQLEKERIERLRLEAHIAPRRLFEHQQVALIGALRAAPQPITIELTLIGNQEAENYGFAIANALGAADVRRSLIRVGTFSPPVYGLNLTIQGDNPRSLAVKAAFEAAKIPVSISQGNLGEFDAKILVGLRPLGPHQ